MKSTLPPILCALLVCTWLPASAREQLSHGRFENVTLYASLKEANERREFLIHELDHRVKNTLASVQGLARQTLRSSDDKESYVESFTGRLQALSRAHVLLTRRMWKNADLEGLAVEALAPFGLNPRDPTFWTIGTKRLERLVDQFEALV